MMWSSRKLVSFIICICMVLAIMPSQRSTNANSVVSKEYSLENGKLNELNLSNDIEISIDMTPSIETSVTLRKGNLELYQKSLVSINVEKIFHVIESSNDYIVFFNRYQGSGGATYFEVFEHRNNELILLYRSEDYLKSSISLIGNQVMVNKPNFGMNDSYVNPSSYTKETFTLKDGGVNFTSSETTAISNGSEPRYESGSRFYTMNNSSENINVNPPPEEISRLLTEKAMEYNVPPEIIKAIAWTESNWLQYRETDHRDGKWKKGDPVIGADGLGIGIMQISKYTREEVANDSNEDIVRLKNDIEYNIEVGIQILIEKWKYGGRYTPVINNNAMDVLDHWYFAILAYNGMSKINDPTMSNNTYQDRVYNFLSKHGEIVLTPFPVSDLVTYYNEGSSIIRFDQKLHYELPYKTRKTHHGFLNTDWLEPLEAVNLRSEPSVEKNQESVIRSLKKGEIIEVTGEVVYNKTNDKHYVWYPVKTQSGEVGYIASSHNKRVNKELNTVRLAGADRFETAVQVSKYGWESAEAIILANGYGTADALSGSVLAKRWNAPLLLIDKNTVPSSVNAEIERLKPSQIYLLGGQVVISKELEEKLRVLGKEKGFTVKRLGGIDRMETAALIAEEVNTKSTEIIISAAWDHNGKDAPDALSVAPYAGAKQTPILLTAPNSLPNKVKEYITKRGVTKVTIIGGVNAVSADVEEAIKKLVPDVTRVAGVNRYDTSLQIAKTFNLDFREMFFTRGDMIFDALSASALAAKGSTPILLIQKDSVPSDIRKFLEDELLYLPKIYFMGGDNAVIPETRTMIQQLILDKFPSEEK